MTGTFKHNLDVLPLAQRRLWTDLKKSRDLGFTLYGGTALALRLGHRESIDFDFFSEKALDREALKDAFPFLEKSTTIQDKDNSWVVLANPENSGSEYVKVSFFGTIGFGRVGEPDITDDGVLLVASLDDLMATKVKVILQRAEAKDYRDIAAMVNAGVSLSRGLASAKILFEPTFQPSESLKALVYFEDGDLSTLTQVEKNTLISAVQKTRDLPEVTLRSRSLSGVNLDENFPRDKSNVEGSSFRSEQQFDSDSDATPPGP